MSKKDKQRVDAAWRREFVIGAEAARDVVRGEPLGGERDVQAGPAMPAPSTRREELAGEVRLIALELVEECAQLSSLAVRLAAIDEASDNAHTLARDALGAAATARGMLFALMRHVEVVPRDNGPWSMLVPPGRDGV